ncbi:hypothetical protein I315_05591 [Cryptococcus gattii Ru294]|nr:hypothetical protein I315_05591 [Cryptococcus gattii Ru294]
MTARSSFIILTDAGQLVYEKKKNCAWCLVLLRCCYLSGLRPALIIGWQSTTYLGLFRSMRLAEPSSSEVASRWQYTAASPAMMESEDSGPEAASDKATADFQDYR